MTYPYNTSCNTIIETEALSTAYTVEDTCDPNLCLYKDIAAYGSCNSEDESSSYHQVDNNNFRTYDQSAVQYVRCTDHDTPIASAECYNNSAAVSYTNVSYSGSFLCWVGL